MRVAGKVSGPRLNAAALEVTVEMVTLDPPVLVRVSDKLELLPTATLPKARLVGLAASVPGVTAVAVADSEAKVCAFGATKEIVVVGSPAVAG